ncbi:Putative disease resistance protein [Arachis hypogaea]|nr:Putative disease resistance protein [Arachis hypogaea]
MGNKTHINILELKWLDNSWDHWLRGIRELDNIKGFAESRTYPSYPFFVEESLVIVPASLQSLQFSHFSNLETLDCKGLHHLTSLKELRIKYCPKLENITQENLPTSIAKLHIWVMQK